MVCLAKIMIYSSRPKIHKYSILKRVIVCLLGCGLIHIWYNSTDISRRLHVGLSENRLQCLCS